MFDAILAAAILAADAAAASASDSTFLHRFSPCRQHLNSELFVGVRVFFFEGYL